jgi:hypothetical protein
MKPLEAQHGGPGRRRLAGRIPRRWLLFVVPALLLAAMLIVLAVQGMVREVVVPPLAYALWLADLVIRSVPQATFWTVLLAIGVYITLRGLVSSGSGQSTAGGRSTASGQGTTSNILQARKRENAAEPPIPSRLEQCQLDMQRINESAFAREKVVFDLRHTVLDVLAYREHQEPAEIEWRVRNGSLDTPPEIRALLLSWQTWFEGRQERAGRVVWLARILQRLGLRRQAPAGPLHTATSGTAGIHASGIHAGSPSLYEYKVEQVIVYLENQLSSQPERQAASEPLPEERTESVMQLAKRRHAGGIHAGSTAEQGSTAV